jgi:hypothetical protein
VTTLFDATIQHLGWFGADFADGGWVDWSPPLSTGLVARSYYAQALNGVALDQAAYLIEGNNSDPARPYWFNVHTANPISGATGQTGYVITPNTRLRTFTRVPHSNDAILWRIVVSDQASTPPPSSPPCQYGTRVQTSQPGTILVTNDLILQLLQRVSGTVLNPLFVAVIGRALDVTGLCDQRPPAWVQLQGDPAANSLGDVWQDLQAIAWPYFCECVPGSPNPVDYPPPSVLVPPNVPAFPTFPCDPADLCSSIALIRQQVFALATQLQSTAELVTLLQRYSLPFAYAPGAIHGALTGEGEFQISRLIGLDVQVDQLPDNPIVLPGKPVYLWDMGWMAISDSGGMLAEKRITRQQQTWLPDACQEALTFSYHLNPDVVISVRELAPER